MIAECLAEDLSMFKNRKKNFFLVSMSAFFMTCLMGCQSNTPSSKSQISSAEHPLHVIRGQDGIQNVRLKMIEINGEKAKFFQQEPYFELQPNQRLLLGNTGCNPLFGTYRLDTQLSKIDFDARAGYQYCSDALAQEAELISILNDIQSYKFVKNQIQFLNVHGQTVLITQKQ